MLTSQSALVGQKKTMVLEKKFGEPDSADNILNVSKNSHISQDIPL